MPPTMIPVSSSNLRSVGYREDVQVLFVAFIGKGGDTLYRYEQFPVSAYVDMWGAASIGSFHYNHIRENPAYPCTKVG